MFEVIVPDTVNPLPDKYEMLAARILARELRSDIRFIERSTIRTPDIKVLETGEYWEIKNIKGNGKFTIEDNLRKATKQSCNVAISLLRSEMATEKAKAHIRWYLKNASAGLKRVVLITKRRNIVDFRV